MELETYLEWAVIIIVAGTGLLSLGVGVLFFAIAFDELFG